MQFVHVGFTSPGGDAYNTDKDLNGFRYDAVPIANGVIMAGGSCDLLQYEPEKHDEMKVGPGRLILLAMSFNAL